MTGTSSINTDKINAEASSGSNTKISFFVYADSGTSLYINGQLDYTFEPSAVSYRVDLKKDDYLSVKTTSKKIEVENFNDFAIDLETNSADGKHSNHIEIGKKQPIVVTKSDKFYALKAKNKEVSPANTKISFFVYADSGTELYINGKLDYTFEPTAVSYRVDLQRDDYLSVKTTSKKIKVGNRNGFAIELENRIGAAYFSQINPKKRKPIVVTKSDKFYVSNTEISFLVYADPGTSLYKDNEFYFKFKANNSSRDVSYRVSLKKNEYLSATTTSNKIEVENTNDFTIVFGTKEASSVDYIESGKKKNITALKSDKFYISKKPGLFMKLDKEVSVYLNNESKPVYTFNGNDYICVTCKLKDDFLTVSKDTSMTVENQNIFDVQLQLKDSKKGVSENTSKFLIPSMHKREKRWLKTERLSYNKKARPPKSPYIHIDKEVEKIIPPKTNEKIKFKIYVLSSTLPEGLVLGEDNVKLQLAYTSPSLSDKIETKDIVADKLIDFEVTGDSAFQLSFSFKISKPEPGDISTEVINPIISIPLVLIAESSTSEQGSINEKKVAMVFSESWSYFSSKEEVLQHENPDSISEINDFIKNSSLKGTFLIFINSFNILASKPEPVNFWLTKILYQNISVLNLVKWHNKYEFYIERYQVSLLQTSKLEFKEIIQYAGRRTADKKTNDYSVNRISKIAFPFPDQIYRESNLWDTMYDSESLLQADTSKDAETFTNFYSIMQGIMPSGGKVKMIRGAIDKNSGSTIDTPTEVTVNDILITFDKDSAEMLSTQFSGMRSQRSLFDLFALCLWEMKKPFVPRYSSRGSSADQYNSQIVNVYIVSGLVSVYKNRNFYKDLKSSDSINLKINEDHLFAVEDSRFKISTQIDVTLQITYHTRHVYDPRISSKDSQKEFLLQENERLQVIKTETSKNIRNTNTGNNGSYDIFGVHRH